MSVEDCIARVETIIKANITAAFAAEDARWDHESPAVTLVVPSATRGYFRHAAAIVEPQETPAIHIVATGTEIIPAMTMQEDDVHTIDVVYFAATENRPETDKRVFRGIYALRRLLRDKSFDADWEAVDADTGFTGINQRLIVGQRYFADEVGRMGATMKAGAVVLTVRESVVTT